MKLSLPVLLLWCCSPSITAFVVHQHRPTMRGPTFLRLSTETDIASMRLKEIQAELKNMGVSYDDCFDRESLTVRLKDAREGRCESDEPSVAAAAAPPPPPPVEESVVQESSSSSMGTAPKSDSEFDRDAKLAELRAMRVAELRSECGKRNIRWANMIEKEDLVQALISALEATAGFSSSGAIEPGKVGELTADDLEAELSNPTTTPLLLDVYAVWCGPCKMMAPQLVEAAGELGDAVRVAKIDSDKYPDWSRKLKIGAFPTVILFGGDGKEVQRVEGALMKDQLIDMARSQAK